MSTSPKMGADREAPVSVIPLTRRPWIGSLPSPLSPLIGRDGERASARLHIKQDARLLSLTGPGGIGKSRLAVQLAIDLRGTFSDGAAWVPLQSVRDVDGFIPGINKTLGFGELPGSTPFQILTSALRDAHLLLVLDNFEQVLDARTQVADLLTHCPHLVALVTSRTLLRISGERMIEVKPLDLPGSGLTTPLEEVANVDAIRLFVARVQGLEPGFALDPESAPLVVDICRRLEGIPLAIELAAARVNHLSLPALRARLERRLPLLVDGPYDLPDRLRTMRGAIAWSYDLLTAHEQALFRRMAAFSGGCRLDAVVTTEREQVAPDGVYVPPEVDRPPLTPATLANIAALTDHSLVRKVNDPDGEPRFVMLETIREYGLEQLDANDEREGADSAKVEYLSAFAVGMEFAPLVSGSERSLALLESEQTHIRESLAWLLAAGERERALRLAGALAYSWIAQGHYREGQSWLEPLLADPDLGSAAERARGLAGLGYMLLYLGDHSRAESVFSEALALWRTQENPLQTAIALIGLEGAVNGVQRSQERESELLEEALALSRTLDDPRLAAFIASMVHATLGMAANSRGQYALAHDLHLKALALRREVNFTFGAYLSLEALGEVAMEQGDYPEAIRYYREGLALAAEHLNPDFIKDAMTNAAHIAIVWGQPERAARLLGAGNAPGDTVAIGMSKEPDRVPTDRVYMAARQALGDAELANSLRAGRALTLDEAIREVGHIEPPPNHPLVPTAAAARYGLSPREVDVLRGIVNYQTDREIAGHLHISRRTVEWHVTGILTKMGVDSRRTAAARATSENLI